MDRSIGGVLVAFAGVVILVAAVKGSLKNLWHAVLTPDSGTPGGSGGAASPAASSGSFPVPGGQSGGANAVPGALPAVGAPGSVQVP